jgi:uncharacterized protein (TIGR01777 family)
MNIFMTGGTGFVGTTMTRKLVLQGHKVTVLTRSLKNKDFQLPRGVYYIEGDPTRSDAWQRSMADHDAVINLAGQSIFKRWNSKTKKAIRDSRVLTTQNLVDALSARKGKETVLLSTSAVGFYGFCGDEDLDEASPGGNDFLASVTNEWEAAALEAEKHGIRVILCRFGTVLGSSGGALNQLVPLFKKGLGSPLGGGKQWFSWIHEQDLVNVYLFLLEKRNISGPINCTAPEPVRNREFTIALGKALGRPTFMPAVPGFFIRLAMGEFGSVLLNGQKVLPKRLVDMGFDFQFSNIKQALEDLL